MRIATCFTMGLLVVCAMANAEIVSKSVDYTHDGATMEGFLAMPSGAGKHPAVLVIQDWNGIDTHEKDVCKRLAELGYVAFAADIYGKGVRPKSVQDCSAESGKYYKDPNLYHDRLEAGLRQLAMMKQVDAKKIGAIGYCFGGTGVLEMARENMPVAAVVSFHGGLKALSTKPDPIRVPALVLTGAADPMVPSDQVNDLEKEFAARKGSVRVVSYPGAGHSFTVKGSDKLGLNGVGYQTEADSKSWAEMRAFFAKHLGGK